MKEEILDKQDTKENLYYVSGEPTYLPTQDTQDQFLKNKNTNTKKVYIESYGCQMNINDSEIVLAILDKAGYARTLDVQQADLILLNTCAIRDKAEQTIRHRLRHIQGIKKMCPSLLVGLLGCMAERLKSKLLDEEKLLDLVVGPDAYKTLPKLIASADTGEKMVNVLLSREETYSDISPVRLDTNGISAFVSIMRGCNNMCSFCIVPFTRGRERSRDIYSILKECEELIQSGYKEITLLGQNVDSYYWTNPKTKEEITFAKLLNKIALLDSNIRIRFSTSHPKDITTDVLETMGKHKNICKYIHLPIQSGSNRILQLMNRSYTREWYFNKVKTIKKILPECSTSTDIITGFCTETKKDHQQTLDAMQVCKYDFAYMFYYSERPGSLAQRKYKDDISLQIKKSRLQEIVDFQGQLSLESMQKEIGKTHQVLIEGNSKKSDKVWTSRTNQNKVVLFDKSENSLKKGDYVHVKIEKCNRATLFGKFHYL